MGAQPWGSAQLMGESTLRTRSAPRSSFNCLTWLAFLVRMAAGAGVFVAAADAKSTTPAPQLHLSAKKTLSVLDGPRTVISAKAFVNFDPREQEVQGEGPRMRSGCSRASLGVCASQCRHGPLPMALVMQQVC